MVTRTPILAEITNLTVEEAAMFVNNNEGIKVLNGHVYAIIGYAYNENELEEYL